MRQAVATDQAPKAIGPYSQGIRAANLLFVSGQIPIDPATGSLIDGDIAAQTRRVFENLSAILKEAGGSLDNVARTTVFLADMGDFAAMNEVYKGFFNGTTFPARTTIQAGALPGGIGVEIDIIAFKGSPSD